MIGDADWIDPVYEKRGDKRLRLDPQTGRRKNVPTFEDMHGYLPLPWLLAATLAVPNV